MTELSDLQKRMYALHGDRKLFEQAKGYAYAYMDGVYDREVFPIDEALAGLSAFDEPIPETGGDPVEMLRLLHAYGSPATVTSTGGRYFGMVVGSVFPPAMAAKWLADVWDQTAALYVSSPVQARLETICEKWVIDLLGLPQQSAMGLVSGSSIATLCGLAAGRHEILNKAGWDVNSQGLFGAPPIRVIVGAEAHSTVFRALSLLGLGKDRVELVPVDEQGRMLASAVPELDSNCMVILQAGNVNSGAFDPLDEICEKAKSAGAWVHVDGAFGLWAGASASKKHLTQGMEKADSWSVDGHKTLNTPYDCGIILCKKPEALSGALQATGSYIQYGEQRDGMMYTPEMSRRGRAVELWATLKVLGRRGVEELVDGLCERAKQFAGLMQAEGFQVLNDVVFNQVLIACDTPEEMAATLANLQHSGECWCGAGKWHDTPLIRVSVCSWVTTAADIERSVAAFVAARKKER
ncbi:MAG: aminotransferase class V-fold PLP-dependent enzyme [Anaerolineaceae bacterium]|jgi:glutamate/tyrosine decarboxylase-like PLP-dependent enzyme|nr:aminotransferase class V-fold PLP-dependent enzyme [Anaerolineaceae bacterium]